MCQRVRAGISNDDQIPKPGLLQTLCTASVWSSKLIPYRRGNHELIQKGANPFKSSWKLLQANQRSGIADEYIPSGHDTARMAVSKPR
jgi:hypothetical protein